MMININRRQRWLIHVWLLILVLSLFFPPRTHTSKSITGDHTEFVSYSFLTSRFVGGVLDYTFLCLQDIILSVLIWYLILCWPKRRSTTTGQQKKLATSDNGPPEPAAPILASGNEEEASPSSWSTHGSPPEFFDWWSKLGNDERDLNRELSRFTLTRLQAGVESKGHSVDVLDAAKLRALYESKDFMPIEMSTEVDDLISRLKDRVRFIYKGFLSDYDWYMTNLYPRPSHRPEAEMYLKLKERYKVWEALQDEFEL